MEYVPMNNLTITYVNSLDDIDFSEYEELEWKPVYTNNIIDFAEAQKRLRATKQNNAPVSHPPSKRSLNE